MDTRDILLLPKKFYDRLSDRKPTLYIGFIVVGIIDLSIFLIEDFSRLFVGKMPIILFYNITLAILLMIVLGFIDVLFFSMPLFDLFKHFKKEKNGTSAKVLVKLMKTYIVANILILPVSVIFYLLMKNVVAVGANQENDYALLFYITVFDFLPSLWLSAAVARGANVIYSFDPRLKRLVFITIFTWSYILASVFGFIINNWVMKLFR